MKLIRLLNEITEISLPKGHAGNESGQELVFLHIEDLLPFSKIGKYEDFSEDSAVNNLGPQFVKDILQNNKVVAENGQYKLIAKKIGTDYTFYLINAKSYLVESTIIGVFKIEKTDTLTYIYNLKRGFNLKAFQVHWSNIAREYRGKGIGKIMYSMVYEYVTGLGAALISDMTLFEGSSGMWRKYMPTIASYFGAIFDDTIIPVTKEDVANTRKIQDLDAFVAMENPPKLIRKIGYNLQGLSFSNGEYGLVRINSDINDKIELNLKGKRFSDEYQMFSNIVEDSTSIKELLGLIKYEISQTVSATGNTRNFRTAIILFNDVIAIVKEMAGKLVVVYV